MSTYETTARIKDVDEPDDAVDRLVQFYRHNGYRIDDDQQSPLRLVRGDRMAGWWASEMTRLHTTIDIETDDDVIALNYRVDTTGQWLTDEDRQFWNDEIAAAADCADGADVVDLREAERERVSEVTGDIRRTGVQALFIVVMAVIGFVVVAHFLG